MSEYKYDLGMYVTGNGKAHGKIIGRARTTAGDNYYTYEDSSGELYIAKENEILPRYTPKPFKTKVGDLARYVGPADYLKGSSGRIGCLYIDGGENMAVYHYGRDNKYVAYVPEDHLGTWTPESSNGVNKKLEDLSAEVRELKEKIASLLPEEKPKTEKVKVEDIKLGDIIYSFGPTSKVVALEHGYSKRLNTRMVKVEVEDNILRAYNVGEPGYTLSNRLWMTYGMYMAKVVDA